VNVTVGTAPDSWGVWFADEPRQTPWQRFLDEAREAGYDWIELGPLGYLPTDPEVLAPELEARSLRVSAGFIMRPIEAPDAPALMRADLDRLGPLLRTLGAGYLVVIDDVYTDLFTGDPIDPAELDDAGWDRLVDNLQALAADARDRFGLQTVVHPHAETHVEYERQIERLLADTDPGLIGVCLDTGHHAYRGGDPVAFLRRHADRIPYLHVKSIDPAMQRRVAAEGIPFALAVAEDMFVEPSQGAVDFAAFLEALREVDYDGFAIVEQDMFPAPFDKPLPIARRTREYLRGIGLG
jgi:inosose dehydratase